jgi:hypothetical protein
VKKNKLKVKKLRGGGMDMGNASNQAASAAMGNAGATAVAANTGNVNLGDTGPQGSESITSFKDNYLANFKAKGKLNFIPGAQILNTLQTVRDTSTGNKAMGIKYKPPVEQQGSDSGPMVCPPGQVMQGGTCVQRLSKGGEFSFNKVTQQDYYKDVL